MCNYVNDQSMQYNWTRTTGDEHIISSLKPLVDQTDGTSNGAYMIVDISQSSSTTINQRARLISPVITPNGEQCVEFWYYSDADSLSSSSKLSVYIRPTSPASSTSSSLIWSKNMHEVIVIYFLY